MDSTLHDVFRVSGWLETLASVLTVLGGTSVLVGSALVTVYLLRRSGLGWWGSVAPMASLWICAAIGSIIKEFVDRPRPDAGSHIPFPSFPSGHAANATAFAVALALAAPWATVTITRRRALIVAASYSIIIGWTRLALGVHWTTDVLAGWVLGGAVAVVVMRQAAGREERSRPSGTRSA